jgi:hypothetical protein
VQKHCALAESPLKADAPKVEQLNSDGLIHLPPPDLQIVHLQGDVFRRYRTLDGLDRIADVLLVDKSGPSWHLCNPDTYVIKCDPL